MMELAENHMLSELLKERGGPCLSVYLPTHRTHPDNLQDPIRYKNLLKEAETSLLEKYSSAETSAVLEPFLAIKDSKELWNHTADGLAVFGCPSFFKVLGLQVPVKELAVVAQSFHTKPIRKYLQSDYRYHILGVSLHQVVLFEGNRHGVTEVKLNASVPANIKDALGDELTEKHLTASSFGRQGQVSGVNFHGHGAKKEEVDKDAERFFNIIDKAIDEYHSKPSGLPLILAALPEHHSLFRKLSNNSQLLENGIPFHPDSVSADKLIQAAWETVEPDYLQRFKDAANRFGQAKANDLGSEEIADVAKAAAEARVDTLLVEADKFIAGVITDRETGKINYTTAGDPEADDLLDDIGELVTFRGGNVMIVPPSYMPSTTGVAAIFRY